MTNLRDHVKAWLESIGADGLMVPDKSIELIKADLPQNSWFYLVPAYRHADGTYHAEKEIGDEPCLKCPDASGDWCKRLVACDAYKHWLAHKEAAK